VEPNESLEFSADISILTLFVLLPTSISPTGMPLLAGSAPIIHQVKAVAIAMLSYLLFVLQLQFHMLVYSFILLAAQHAGSDNWNASKKIYSKLTLSDH
jgi:hypothetical protein